MGETIRSADEGEDVGTGWSAYDGRGTMTRQRLRSTVLLASGMLIDAYDLLAVGAALLFLQRYFHMDSGQAALVTFVGFLGAAVGMVAVGDLTDRFGRRVIFVINLVVFVVFAVVSASVTNVPELLAVRFLMGLGIGADVPTSMSYVAEVTPAQTRGYYLGGLTQILWVCGALLATVVAVIAWPLAGDEAWRWVFGLGAVPALVVLALRQGVPESPRWLARRGRAQETTASLRRLGLTEQPGLDVGSRREGSIGDLFRRPYRARLAMTSSIFALIGFSAGVTTVAAPFVFHYFGLLGIAGSLASSMLIWIVALIGTIISAPLFDRFGRIPIGVTAASVTTVALVVMGLFGKGDPAVLIITYFLVTIANWAGSGVWWTLSAELFPTSLRGRASGIANAACRLTVGADVYIIASGSEALGFNGVILVFAASTLVMAVILALSGKWEPKQATLEVAAAELPHAAAHPSQPSTDLPR
jgi:MFS transporter, putative metabolite transport protein